MGLERIISAEVLLRNIHSFIFVSDAEVEIQRCGWWAASETEYCHE